MIGTRGVPAQYGGFETAVEEIGARLSAKGHAVTVYCRNPGQTLTSHRGMDLVNLPALRNRYTETLSHTFASVAHALRNPPDACLLFNAGNAPVIPLLRMARVPVAVHMDGLEWQRAKWSGAGHRYYLYAERSAARAKVELISDSRGIADYLLRRHGRDSHYIAYGAPVRTPGTDRLSQVGVEPDSYHLVVARMEPENNVDLIIRGHRESASRLPLVVVGSVPYNTEYMGRLQEIAESSEVRLLGSVWDQELLDQLYGHCRSYLHGHSVGGTNPSLLRAMGCGAPVSAFDVVFNREVAEGTALYFRSAADVALCIRMDDSRPARDDRGSQGALRIASHYNWNTVAAKYEELLLALATV